MPTWTERIFELLLLTFFHRQMPEIIKAGHLFIAQPPLFKVAKGRSEVYLKDQAALDRYLVGAGLEKPGARIAARRARAGPDLASLVEHAMRLKSLLGFVPRKYDMAVVEAMALAGALDPALRDGERGEALDRAAAQLQQGDPEARWQALVTDTGAVRFERIWRGVTDVFPIEHGFLASAEARKLHARAQEQAEVYSSPARLAKGGVADPEPVVEDAADDGKR